MKSLTMVALLLLSGAIQAEEKIDYFSFSDSFAECSALQNTLARFVTSSEEEYLNHYLHQVANGAFVVAADFAVAGGYKKELATSQYELHYSKFQSLLKATPNNFSSFENAVKQNLDKCIELSSLQADLIVEKRKKMYKSK